MIEFTNEDCMDLMGRYDDNYFDLAIVDPPYGINKDSQKLECYEGVKAKHNRKEYISKGWDNERPKKEYFKELKRVSKNQIIWGANYFIEYISSTSCFLFWDKGQKLDQADGELAYCSIQKPIRSILLNRVEIGRSGGNIHPTQKPVKLYEWILHNYAKEGNKILDTHGGSLSIAIACHNLKFDLIACELDKDYYEAAKKRLENHQKQLTLF